MFAGDYLASNLGHEIINLFQADNKKHYIYLNPKGNFDKTHKDKETGNDKIKYMLFVKTHSSKEFEVIGLATGLKSVKGVDCTLNRKLTDKNEGAYKEQVEYIENEKVKYGGVEYGGIPIFELFNDAEQQSIFITYEAKKVFIPKMGKRIFISYDPDSKEINTDKSIKIVLKGYNKPSTSLHSYIYPEGTFKGDGTKPNEETKKKRQVDYKNLINNLISKGDDLWQIQNKGVNDNDIKEIKPREVSLFDICQILDDENRYSNVLAYFMGQPKYKELWVNFFWNVECFNLQTKQNENLKIKMDFNSAYEITREESAKIEDDTYKKNNSVTGGGRIDIVVRDKSNIVVIENKIKSDVNTVPNDKKDKTQLNRYVEYISWSIDKGKEKENVTPHFIILTPNYNIPEISKAMKQYYKIITYGDLYNFLEKEKSKFEDDVNFVAFFEAMHRHTHENVNDYLYYDMLEKFVRRIKEANASKVVSRTDPNNPNQGIVRPEDCQLPEGFEPLTGDLIYDKELGEAICKSEGY